MKISATHLKAIESLSEVLKTQSSMLQYNVKYRRVTHTGRLVPNICETLCKIRYETSGPDDFIYELKRALFNSQNEPISFEPSFTNDEVFIQGTFSIDKLRQLLCLSDYPSVISIEGGDNAKS